MHGVLFDYLATDHRRLEELLHRAARNPDAVEMPVYDEFRKGLLRHIAMEEKVLIPAVRALRGGESLSFDSRLRLDHGAITALLVPPPTAQIINALRGILERHNELEEGPGGWYAACEEIAGEGLQDLLARIESVPDVPLSPSINNPNAVEPARRALERAGYNLDDYSD